MAVRGINKVMLVGRLGKDPEVRYIPNGGAVANLQVATSETWRDKQTGEMREQTEWHRVVLFGKLAEVAGEYLRKGAQVYIEGQLRTRSWEDNGITRYVTEILVKTTGTMQMLGRAAGAQTQPEEGQQFSAQPQPEPQSEAGTKKGGAKTKGRGRKAAQPEPQLQPPEGDDYGFSDDIRAAGSDERRELTHAVMRELDAPDNWTMNGEYGSEFGGFFPVQVRFTPAHERFHLALCSPGDVSQVWVLVLVNAGGEPFAVVQVQRRFAPEAVSHSLALAASLDAQGYSVNDIIHILMAEGGQA